MRKRRTVPISPTRWQHLTQYLDGFWQWVVGPHVRASAVAVFVTGFAGDLAARRRQPDAYRPESSSSQRARAHSTQERSAGRDHGRTNHDHQGIRRHQDSGSGSNDRSASDQHHSNHHGQATGQHREADADIEAKQTPTPTPPPQTGGAQHGGGNAGGANGHSNAESAPSDNPLTTKALRRTKAFPHHDGTVTSQNGSVSVSTGPDGLSVRTGDISYHAALTPTPTPFPRRALPSQGVTSATPVASGHGPTDPSGGNLSTDFMS